MVQVPQEQSKGRDRAQGLASAPCLRSSPRKYFVFLLLITFAGLGGSGGGGTGELRIHVIAIMR